jgi:membrane-associated phospholipid phosphatase
MGPPSSVAARLLKRRLPFALLPSEFLALLALLLLALAWPRLPAYNLPGVFKLIFMVAVPNFVLAGLAAAFAWAAVLLLKSRREGGCGRFLPALRASDLGTVAFWSDSARMVLAWWIVFTAHFLVKISIHLLNPAVFDPLLWRYDRWLCLGWDPVPGILKIVTAASALRALDLIYSTIYPLTFIVFPPLLMVLGRTRSDRVRFMTAFILVWLTGGILYVAFPSWGPVFTKTALFENTLPHMPHTVGVQRELYVELKAVLETPMGPRPYRYGGVAAFPSLHLALMTLYTLAAWRVSRGWGVLTALFTAAMFVGSMVTGYHYFTDSVAGAVLGAVLFYLAGRWTGWSLGDPPPAVSGGKDGPE